MRRNGSPRHVLRIAGPALVVALAVQAADGASHLWRIQEIFSNADGTIQFIEMKECCGATGENFIDDKWVQSQATLSQFTFDANLPGNTANRHLLLATAGFAALPGAPTPDFIIPDGFLSTDGDLLKYWFYTNAFFEYGPGQLPTDGVTSLHCTLEGSGNDNACATYFTETNSPTNYNGQSGTISVCPGDLDHSGDIDVNDLVAMILAWGSNPGHPADLNADDSVGVEDLVTLMLSWGPCG